MADTYNAILPLNDYLRYGRQMVLDGFGLPGQVKLQKASVVVIGAGGLGCPALQYLTASGIGRLGVVDHDVVELSNLHRQVLHSEETVGMFKAESAAKAIKRINSQAKVDIHTTAINSTNAVSLLSSYDVILDCSDNPPTRYLLSDTAVYLSKPLVSGAAQKFEGQLCTYNMDLGKDSDRGPCYRCLFSKPVAPEMAGTCAETGILGAVTGVIGTLQALEAIKIITGLHDQIPTMLIYSALALPPFRSIKMRNRRRTCPACGDTGERIGEISSLDYVTFCGGPAPNWEERGLITDRENLRIRAEDLKRMLSCKKSVRILDVRPRTEFGICHLSNSINIPLRDLILNPSVYNDVGKYETTVVVCRLGNDSQLAAETLRDHYKAIGGGDSENVVDLIGGLKNWSKDVDSNFPVY